MNDPRRFSVTDLPEHERVERWEEHNAAALIGVEARTLGETVLDATEVNVELGRIQLARVAGSSHLVERNLAMVRNRPADAVAVYFSLVGESFFYHDGGMVTRAPGQLLVVDADRPFLRGFHAGLEELVLKLPRALFAELTGSPTVPTPVLHDFGAGANSFANALARHVDRATRAEPSVVPDEESLLALLRSMLGGPSGADIGSAHLAAARAYIDQHLADPSLSAARVADAVGISPRQLSRVFAGLDTTVPRYLLGRRLDAARSLMTRPSHDGLSLADLAASVGFVSTSHFSTAFTARFDERPSDLRRRLRVAR